MSIDRAKRGHGAPVVIVEIGNDWLKVARIDRSPSGPVLARVDIEKLDPQRGMPADKLAALLRPYVEGGGTVYGCLPRQLATVRVLELPSTDPVEIADMVDLQAGKLTPYTKDEIVVDYKIAGPGRDGYTKVMLVIVQRSVLRNRFSMMEEAGLPLSTMSIGTEGILNWIRKAYPSGSHRGAVAVLDVDAGFSDFAVMAADRLLFSRSILIGAASLQADGAAARERLVREVVNSLQSFAGENAGVSVDRLLLTGAGGNLPELVPELAARVEMPVETADCLQVFRKTPNNLAMTQAPRDTMSLTAICGMALDLARLDFRLVPESVRLRKELVQKARALTLLGCLMVTALALFSMWGTLRYVFKRERLGTIRRQVEAQAEAVQAVEQKMKLVDVVQKRRDQRLAVFHLLRDVHESLPNPETIVVDGVEFDQDRGTIQISGSGASAGEIRELVKGLEGSPRLTDVREDGTTTQEGGGRFRFRLLCRMEDGHVG